MTITLTREEAQQVLDAMIPYQQKVIATTKEYGVTVSVNNEIETAIKTLRARLSAPEPEPVACPKEPANIEELYTAPPQREWQGLTLQEIEYIESMTLDRHDAIRLAAVALQEKNGG